MENKKYSNQDNSNSQRNNFKKKTYSNDFQKREYRNSNEQSGDRPKTYSKSSNYVKKEYYKSSDGSYDKPKTNTFRRSNNENRFSSDRTEQSSYKKTYNSKDNSGQSSYKKPFNPNFKKNNDYKKTSFRKSYTTDTENENVRTENVEIRLNKFIADAGICSRRNADVYISSGNVQVNGEVMTTLGYRVKPTDIVKFDGKVISSEKKEYILLNKPKGFITTTNDEKGRKTVMDLVANATKARILPVGRLDRPTTGLLLLTNDGELAKKLTHPTHGVRKIYHVVLDKKLDYKDFIKIEEGFELEDGFIQVDEISYVNDKPKNEIGVKIHSGRNRIVRRIFEHLGYNVEKLDRVVFAGLTKKDLPRGHWRKLTQQEIINLKNIK